MFQRPLDQHGVAAMSSEQRKALRGSPRLALDIRQCQLLGVVDFFEGGPLLQHLVESSSEPDDQLIRRAVFGGQPLPRPLARYAVLEPREVSELAAQLPSVSMAKLKRRLEQVVDEVDRRYAKVELAAESVQDCMRYFRAQAKKGHAILQWNEEWKEGLRYRPAPALTAVVGREPRRLEDLVEAFNAYVRKRRLVDASRQLRPDEALEAVLGSKKRPHLELTYEVIGWLRPHLEPVLLARRGAAASRSKRAR